MIEEPLGTLNRPIVILSEEDELIEFNKKIEEATNKALIEEAIMIGQPLSVMQAVVKSKIPGNLAVKNKAMDNEILEYYHQRLNIKINSQFFTPKLEPNYSNPEAQPNLSQFVLYGVDFLSTNQIRDHFVTISGPQKEQQNQSSNITHQKTNPFATLAIRRILWVNDSSCKLIFKSSEDARLIINSQLKDQSKLLKDDGQIFKGWFQLKPYSLYSFQRPLFIRYSTTLERTIIKSISDKYSLFEKAQSSIIPQFLKKFKGEERYNELLKQIQLEKNSKQKRNSSSQPRVRSRDTNKPNNFAQCQQMPPYKNNYKRSSNNNEYRNSNQQTLENKNFNKDEQKNNVYNGENVSTFNKGNNQSEYQNSLSYVNKNSLIQENDEMNISLIGNNIQNHLSNENSNLSFTLNDKMVQQSLEINYSMREDKQIIGQKGNNIKEKMVSEEKEYENILPPQLLDQKQNRMEVEVKQATVINLDGDYNDNSSQTLNNDFFKQICQMGDTTTSEKQQRKKQDKSQHFKVEVNKSALIEIKPKGKLQTIQKIGQIIFNPKNQTKLNTIQHKSNKIQEATLKGGNEIISTKESMKSLIAKQPTLGNQVKIVNNRSQGSAFTKQGQEQKQGQIKQTQDNKQLQKESKDTKNANIEGQAKPLKQKEAFISKQSQSLSNSIKQKETKNNVEDNKQKKNLQDEYKWNILDINTKNHSAPSQQSYGKADNRSYSKDDKNYGTKNQNVKRRDNRNSAPEPQDHGEPISY